MLNVPPFTLAAGLLLWGAVSGFVVVALLLALAVEAGRWSALRFDLRARDFERIADLCSAALAVVLAYSLLGKRNFSESLVAALLWLPMLFAPLILAQRLSVAGTVPLSALFWSLRRRRRVHMAQVDMARRPHLAQDLAAAPAGRLDFVYLCVCLLAASAANVRTLWFYAALCVLVLVALWPQRAPGSARAAWPALAGLALAFGFAVQLGLSTLQSTLEEAALEWLHARWQGQADPYRARTAIGDIGSLKASDRIVLRVDGAPGTSLPLLRHASYNRYAAGVWTAPAQPFQGLAPQGRSWVLAQGTATRHLRVSGWMSEGRALLALPLSTLRVEQLDVGSVQRNGMGAVRVEEGTDPLVYEAWFDPQASADTPPGAEDLVVPAVLAPLVGQVAQDLGLPGADPPAVLRTLHAFFATQFAYSLDLESAGGQARGLARFLLQDRRGHCEYFATASVLLLRAAGVPARYATGYAVQEWSPIEGHYVVRARHAHAWALAWVGDRWQEVDTTPAVWAEAEAQQASALQPLYDLASAVYYRFARWRADREHSASSPVTWTLLAAPLAAYVLWRVWRRRLRRSGSAQPLRIQTDARLTALLAALARQGYMRPTGTPLLAWVRALPLADSDARALLDEVVRSYYQLRFDPAGVSPAGVHALEAKSAALLARIQGNALTQDTIQ